jgi:glycosyltransferase involved in cell wall biosynthesis
VPPQDVSVLGTIMDRDSDSSVGSATRVLLIADARSPTTWGWIEAVRSAGAVVLDRDGRPWPERQALNAGSSRPGATLRLRSLASSTPRRLKMVQKLKRTFCPILASIKGHRLRRSVDWASTDVVHALRIPYEAMTALAACPREVPLTVSIWGNDLTLHASTNRIIGQATRRVLARADMLFADCERDIELAERWGFRPGLSTAVLPGGGGIQLHRPAEVRRVPESPLANFLNSNYRLIVNARGCREYVRNDILLKALSFLAGDLDPSVRIVFIDAVHDRVLYRSIENHPLAKQIVITGKYLPSEMFSVFGRTEIYVSITSHDGTPNSLLESMAAGAIPVCGDLPSIREWISHESNGFLAAFDDFNQVAEALHSALKLSDADRSTIRLRNSRIIAARAERGITGRSAVDKYRGLVKQYQDRAPWRICLAVLVGRIVRRPHLSTRWHLSP